VVTLLLPLDEDGPGSFYPLAYVSHAGPGIFTPLTGVWTIGSIPSGTTVTLLINVSIGGPITPGLHFTGIAEITASSVSDPD
jgi:hypothetical protein